MRNDYQIIKLVALLGCGLVAASCTTQDQRLERLVSTKPGSSAAQLIRDVGNPTSVRLVSHAERVLCGGDVRNTRELEYRDPEDAVDKLLGWFGRPAPRSGVVVCVDADDRITATHIYAD